MTGATDQYAVIGHPVAHSLSPRIHRAFAAQTGQALEYIAIEAPLDGFAAVVSRFREAGGRGLNVTVPFKEEAWRLADALGEAARAAGAANTLTLDAAEGIRGDNTDGVGLLTDLTANLGLALTGRRILLLGAGGAARGVAGPLLDQAPELLLVANRGAERATRLAADFSARGPIRGTALDALAGEPPFDLIVNATAASLSGSAIDLPEGLICEGTVAYDMVYADVATPFMQWATSCGAVRAVDGLGMLVEQAAESFRIWRGVRPQTPPVIADLRTFLGAAYA
ncbi:shikimate dehydrogenase [Acidihalobacter aeolianus]|uniref:Shikimate dehydrogenase (NADP(+)) n=1 Tax=Acidihalobacter aeolianus TaxID=2792603 RepID=A0A1D8KB69_9GAMM|nr:shikimate dehydrogenase [Acidihalobacter aeolianus]AOV18204.1 shikimate dehydrogenase [Acidihalobacter aeolianus]